MGGPHFTGHGNDLPSCCLLVESSGFSTPYHRLDAAAVCAQLRAEDTLLVDDVLDKAIDVLSIANVESVRRPLNSESDASVFCGSEPSEDTADSMMERAADGFALADVVPVGERSVLWPKTENDSDESTCGFDSPGESKTSSSTKKSSRSQHVAIVDCEARTPQFQ